MASKIGEQTSKGRYLVIGAGYAGLAVAIELRRKGFKVEVIEAVKELTTQGMCIRNREPPGNLRETQRIHRRYHSTRIQCDQSDEQMGSSSRQRKKGLCTATINDHLRHRGARVAYRTFTGGV